MSGFNFSTTNNNATPSFNLGSTNNNNTTSTGFNFGTKPSGDNNTAKLSFNLGTSSNKASTGSSLFNLSSDKKDEKATPAFNLGSTNTSSSGFNLGTKTDTTTTTPSFNLGSTNITTTNNNTTTSGTTGFSFGDTSKTNESKTNTTTGFSFGDTSKSTTATNSATPAFNLSTTTTKKTDTTTTTTPSFNLGNSNTTTTNNNTTTGFSFGDTSKTTTNTTNPTNTTNQGNATNIGTENKTQNADATLLRIKDMTIDEIVTLWNADLEGHIRGFTSQAAEVMKWDEQLRENGGKILELQDTVRKTQEQQKSLIRILETIKSNQNDLHQLICDAEKKLDSLPPAKLSPDEMKREDAYNMASDIDSELVQMSVSLRDTITNLNKASERCLDPHNPLTPIVKILNIQMNSLQYVERTVRDLETNLSSVPRF